MIIEEISRNEYDNYLKDLDDYSFLQTSDMKMALESNNRETRLLALKDKGEIRAVGLGFIRKFLTGKRIDFMVGASSTDKDYEYLFYDKMKDYAKENDFLKLVIKLDEDYATYDQNGGELSDKDRSFFEKMKEVGYIENDGSVPEYDGSPDFQFVKDLSDFMPDDYDKLLKSFNKNAQRQIKKGIELDIKVRPIAIDEMEDFKALTLETAKRQGFGDKSLNYYRTFYKEFGSATEFLQAEIDLDNSIGKIKEILVPMKDNAKNKQRIASLKKDIVMLEDFKETSDRNIIPLANMILVYEKNQAVYFLGGSLTKYQKLPGPFILQYEAMKRIMERGFATYNFFGIDGVYDGSDGVLRFKQNFNGYIVRKTGAFIYYPDERKVNRLQFLKNAKNKLAFK